MQTQLEAPLAKDVLLVFIFKKLKIIVFCFTICLTMASSSSANLLTNLSLQKTATRTLTINNFKNDYTSSFVCRPLVGFSQKRKYALQATLFPRGIFKQHRDHLFITLQLQYGANPPLYGQLLVYIEDDKGEKAEPLGKIYHFQVI